MTQKSSRSEMELSSLQKQHEAKRSKTLMAVEALRAVRAHALLDLQKTQILFKYLNWKQQERIESLCKGDFSLKRINSLSAVSCEYAGFTESAGADALPCRKASYVQQVQTARKIIVQFSVIEARIHELIAAISKSIAVLNYQYKTAYRELFPLGFVSRIIRRTGQFFHHPFYSWQEIGCLANLGMAAGFVFKMADAPVLGERR